MAMNKAQAQRYKKQRTTNYGSEPGEVTSGLKPGDRYYDPDTNTWQLKADDGDGNDIENYLDEIMDTAGLGAKDVQGSTSGNSGTGSGGSGKSTEASSGATEGDAQDSEGNWIIPAAVAAGGAAAIAAWVASRKKGKPSSTSTVSDPATDTAGEADKGGTGTEVAKTNPTYYDDIDEVDPPITAEQDMASRRGVPYPDDGVIDATFDDASGQYRLPSDVEELPAFNDVINAYRQGRSQMGMGSQPAASVANPDVPAAASAAQLQLPQGTGNMIDQSIASVDGPNAPLVDPDMEQALQAYAEQLRGQGDFNPSMDPSKVPGLPSMDPYVMQRLKAILSGM